MHERRAGLRIETDAAALKAQPDLAQLFEPDAGNEEIHGAAENVLAVARDALAVVAEHGVGLRRTVAAHDLDRQRRTRFALHLPEQIDQARIHAGRLAFAPVAQEPVELGQRGLVVAPVALVGDDDVLAGMKVVHGNGARFAFGDRVLQGFRTEQEKKKREGSARRERSTRFQLRATNVHWQSRGDAFKAQIHHGKSPRRITPTHC